MPTSPSKLDVNPEVKLYRLRHFMEFYEPALLEVVKQYPDQYYPVTEVPTVAEKMRRAFADGTYNVSGEKAIARACRRLGIKNTRQAIDAFLRGL